VSASSPARTETALDGAWREAQKVWDVGVTLSQPRPTDKTDKAKGQADELAYIDLETRQVVVNLALLGKMDATTSLTAVLAHELGHHVKYPHTLALAASLILLEKRLIPGLQQSLTNLFFDLLVNEHVGRTRHQELCAVYRGFQKQLKAKEKMSPVFLFYLAVYEELWNLEPGALVPKEQLGAIEKSYAGFRNDARVFAQTFYAIAGIHRQFVYFCSRFIRYIEDPTTFVYLSPFGKDGASPDADDFDSAVRGLHSGDIEDALLEAKDNGWLKDGGLKDEQDDDPLVTIDKITEHLPGKGGGEFKLALVSKHYKRLVDQHIIKPPPGSPTPEPTLPSVLEDWEWGDSPKTIDWTGSVLARGPLAGVHPLRRDLLPDDPSPVEKDFPAVEIYLDTSGSMPNPQAQLNVMTLAAQILCASCLRKGGKVRGAIYSSGPVMTCDWLYDEERARRFFLHYVGGGTDYPFKLLRKWSEETRDVIRVIISDSDFLSNVLNPTSSLKPLDTLQFATDRSRLLVAFLAADAAHSKKTLQPALKQPRFRLAIVKSFDGFAQAAAELADALFGR
jgi:hypothetical protein